MKKYLAFVAAILVLAACSGPAPQQDYLYLTVSADRSLAHLEKMDLEPGTYRMLTDGSDPRLVSKSDSFSSPVRNGKIVYAVYGQIVGTSDLWIADADGQSARAVMVTPKVSEDQPQWSTSGHKIGYVGPQSVFCTVDPDGQHNWCLDPGQINGRRVFEFAFGPDEQTLVLVTNDSPDGFASGRMYLLKLNQQGEVASVTDLGEGREATFSPNGRQLIFKRQGQLYMIYLSTGGTVQLPDVDLNEFAWSPTGGQIALSSFDGKLRIVNELLADAWVLYDLPGYQISNLSWSPDGKQLAFMASRYFANRYQVDLIVAQFERGKFENITYLKSFDFPDVGYAVWLKDWVTTN